MTFLIHVFVVFIKFTVKSSFALETAVFEIQSDVKISSDFKASVHSRFGRQQCAVMCLSDMLCRSANFYAVNNTCEFNLVLPAEEPTNVVTEANWEILRPNLDNSWRLVFRASAGTGISIKDAWMGAASLPSPTESCQSQSFTCLTHYRSSIINSWNTQNIQQVRFVLYKNNDIVVNILFNNVAGQDSTVWFNQDRIVSSSYTDMTPKTGYNYFSLRGFELLAMKNRFHISASSLVLTGCYSFTGWISITDGNCDLDKDYPLFEYAPNNQKSTPGGFLFADVLDVFVY